MSRYFDIAEGVLEPIWTPPPRVVVSNNMLYAYSEMRGNQDKKDISTQSFGPLHDALFSHPRDHPYGDVRAHLPSWPRSNWEMTESLPKGIAFFWDPLSPCYYPSLQIPKEEHFYVRSQDSEQSYAEFKARNPPEQKGSHYRGEDCFGNYNYIKVNNCWVDPDSEGDVYDATTNTRNQNELLISGRMRPRVMTLEEQDIFYKEFAEECAENGEDPEGDPRALRISPAVFARWAVGAANEKGNSYVDVEPLPQEKLARPRPSDPWRVRTPPPHRRIQYDEETGSMMSGVYNIERSPSMAWSAKGVDITSRPGNYARSYPQGAIELDLAAFGNNTLEEVRKRTGDWLVTSSGSGPIQPRVFNSAGAASELVSENEPSIDGDRKYDKIKTHLNTLQDEHLEGVKQNVQRYGLTMDKGAEGAAIHREIFIMERYLEHTCPRSKTPPLRSFPLPTPPRRKIKKKSTKYARYFQEMESRNRVGIGRAQAVNKRLDEEILPVLAGIRELEILHRDLRKQIGVETSEDISQLVAPLETGNEAYFDANHPRHLWG